MKKFVSLGFIVLVVLGVGFYLFKISPQNSIQPSGGIGDFNVGNVTPGSLSQPRPQEADEYVLGNPQAKNILVVYEDFQCPYCGVASDMVQKAASELTDTKVLVRHYPLSQHRNSVVSAYAAEAAGAQGKFWEMYNLLYKNQSSWSELANPLEYFIDLAKNAGVIETEKFRADIISKKHKDKVEKDLKESIALNLQGTPSFYFNGKPIPTTYKMEELKKSVESLYIK